MRFSRDADTRYRVVINYDTSVVSVSVARGLVVESSIDISPPSILYNLLGATIEKRIHNAAGAAQQECDELNAKLDKMRQACEDAEAII